MKRVLIGLSTVLLLLTVSVAPVFAAARRVVTFENSGDSYRLVSSAEEATFWQAPDLQRGASVTGGGELIVHNTADVPCVLTLASVEFPYTDEAAMVYLNHLILTIRTENATVYEGPYSHINNADDGWHPEKKLSPNEEAVYQISLRCDYNYTGKAVTWKEPLNWKFSAQVNSADTDQLPAGDPAEESPDAAEGLIEDNAPRRIAIAAIITVVVLAVGYAAGLILRKRS